HLPLPDTREVITAATALRDAESRGWVSTPELFLGPAFRSLAPPIPL
ncbi:MAG: hypothetical protein JWM04_1488, partial [Verrucomicrobiales bacterium]|nr:hypothetical protein [Verrucomicrobiales bacterium]